MLFETEIIVGTYEQFIMGFTIAKEKGAYKFVNTFALKDQNGSIRCLASSKKYVAVASSDDTIWLYDMETRHCAGNIHDTGIATSMDFTPDGSYLITGSQNGVLTMYCTGSWIAHKHWTKPHLGSPVYSVVSHNTSTLALTVGGDGKLRAWNLVKGRSNYTKEALRGKRVLNHCQLKFSPNGDHYATVSECNVSVFNTFTVSRAYTYNAKVNVTCISFINNAIMCFGTSDGNIEIHNFIMKTYLHGYVVHESRVKGIICIAQRSKWFIITAASCGEIILWKHKNDQLLLLCRAGTRCRITCMVSYDMQRKEEKIEGPTAEECINKSRMTKAAAYSTHRSAHGNAQLS